MGKDNLEKDIVNNLETIERAKFILSMGDDPLNYQDSQFDSKIDKETYKPNFFKNEEVLNSFISSIDAAIQEEKKNWNEERALLIEKKAKVISLLEKEWTHEEIEYVLSGQVIVPFIEEEKMIKLLILEANKKLFSYQEYMELHGKIKIFSMCI